MRQRVRVGNARIFGSDAETQWLWNNNKSCEWWKRSLFIHVICGTAENCRPPAAAGKIDSINAAQHGSSSSRVGGLRFQNLSFLPQLAWLSSTGKRSPRCWLDAGWVGKSNTDWLSASKYVQEIWRNKGFPGRRLYYLRETLWVISIFKSLMWNVCYH